MAKEEMSVTDYATLRGITRQAILKQIVNSRALPGVSHYRKVGNGYVLTVDRKKVPQKE